MYATACQLACIATPDVWVARALSLYRLLASTACSRATERSGNERPCGECLADKTRTLIYYQRAPSGLLAWLGRSIVSQGGPMQQFPPRPTHFLTQNACLMGTLPRLPACRPLQRSDTCTALQQHGGRNCAFGRPHRNETYVCFVCRRRRARMHRM